MRGKPIKHDGYTSQIRGGVCVLYGEHLFVMEDRPNGLSFVTVLKIGGTRDD